MTSGDELDGRVRALVYALRPSAARRLGHEATTTDDLTDAGLAAWRVGLDLLLCEAGRTGALVDWIRSEQAADAQRWTDERACLAMFVAHLEMAPGLSPSQAEAWARNLAAARRRLARERVLHPDSVVIIADSLRRLPTPPAALAEELFRLLRRAQPPDVRSAAMIVDEVVERRALGDALADGGRVARRAPPPGSRSGDEPPAGVASTSDR